MTVLGRSRSLLPGVVVVVVLVATFFLARQPVASSSTRSDMAAPYSFRELPIAMPAGYRPTRTVRDVNPAYENIRAWISSVGAGIAMTDLTGSGRSAGLCIVDPRTDQVVVTWAPTATAADRFTPFVLDPAPLPMDSAMAPMGCTPGDYNLDGRTDLLVTYWGRTPVLFLARSGATGVALKSYKPVEMVPTESLDGRYHGPRWNTNALTVGDFDGSGQPDVLVSNYFPDSDVLDPQGLDDVAMNDGLSNARNGGGAHMLRWLSAEAGAEPSVKFVEERGAIDYDISTGWTLAASNADLTADGLPEIYIANDFGKDHLLFNRSTPGRIRFTHAIGERTPTTAKSFVVGHSSFKGMGVDFVDLDQSGQFDMIVSNITTAWGLEESNFTFMNDAPDEAGMARDLSAGFAPFTQRAREMGLAWTGWGWDIKAADFTNRGRLDIVQTEGFVKGEADRNRWAWLQEMAMNNDNVFTNPRSWPHVRPGDDIAGRQPFAFYVRGDDGRFVDLHATLGLTTDTPTRGVAIADTRGNGLLDFAVARQWGPPSFFVNEAPDPGQFLGLRLVRPAAGPAGGLQGVGTPAYDAVVKVTTADGRSQVTRLDGGGGHSGKRSFDVHVGLGEQTGPVRTEIRWRDTDGSFRTQVLQLTPGSHTLRLDDTAEEVASR